MKAVVAWMLVGSMAASSAPALDGSWVGTASRGGEQTAIRIDFRTTERGIEARYSIPVLDLEDIPLPGFILDPETNALKAGHALSAKVENGRIAGDLRPILLHDGAASITLAPGPRAADHGTIERPVEFTSRGLTLKGTLVRPVGQGAFPALVSLHGSGPSTRWLALARARRFARAGYAMLIFDKPGSGESEGDWTMTSLDEMASDALAAVEFLRSQPGIDRGRVGLWAHSQAGWVVSRAAARPNSHAAFAIVLAGGGSPPREVEEYGYRNRLRRSGASADLSRGAMAWVRRYLDYEASGKGYPAVVSELARHPEWKQALGVSAVYPTPEQQPKWAWVASYRPLTDIARIRIPILLLFAEQDENTPSQQSLERWRRGLAKAGNAAVEWHVVPGADHHFLTPVHTEGWPSLARGFYETQIGWLDGLFASRGGGRTNLPESPSRRIGDDRVGSAEMRAD